MKHHFLNRFLSLIGFCAAFSSGVAHAGEALSLEDPLGRHRLLVLCLLEQEDDINENIAKIYKSTDWENFAERDLYYIELRPDAAYTVTPETDLRFNRILHQSGSALRAEANCGNDFEFVLIGNDGTQKRRWTGAVPSQELFATIDAMPFRQFEMWQQGTEKTAPVFQRFENKG